MCRWAERGRHAGVILVWKQTEECFLEEEGSTPSLRNHFDVFQLVMFTMNVLSTKYQHRNDTEEQ